MIQGLVREVGGESAIFSNLSITLWWGESALPISTGPWDNPSTMNFQIRAKAQEYMNPGENTISIEVGSDQERFLNGVSRDVDIFVLVEVDFEISNLELSNGQRVIRGTVNVTARDTGEPLENLSLTASLANGSVSHFSVSKLTDSYGVFEYEFKSMAPLPPLSQTSPPPEGWGELSVMLGSDSEFLDPGSLALLPLGGVPIDYEKKDSESFFGNASIAIVALATALIVVSLGSLLISRRRSAIKELASIFGQTVEMLASGDELSLIHI